MRCDCSNAFSVYSCRDYLDTDCIITCDDSNITEKCSVFSQSDVLSFTNTIFFLTLSSNITDSTITLTNSTIQFTQPISIDQSEIHFNDYSLLSSEQPISITNTDILLTTDNMIISTSSCSDIHNITIFVNLTNQPTQSSFNLISFLESCSNYSSIHIITLNSFCEDPSLPALNNFLILECEKKNGSEENSTGPDWRIITGGVLGGCILVSVTISCCVYRYRKKVRRREENRFNY